jgi:hypothetical protein
MPSARGWGMQKKRQEVRERAVGDLGREREHPAPQRRDDDRDGVGRRALEPEAAESALAREHGAQALHGLAHVAQGPLERHAVPPLDDDPRRRADAQHEAPA